MADKIAKRGVSIFIDGKEVKNSVAGISAEMRKLQAEQKKMTIGADDYIAHGKKIAYLDSLFQEHKANQKAVAQEYKKMGVEADSYAKKAESSISKMANGINKYIALFTGALAAVTGLTLGFKKFMDMRMELEDASANLQSLTGLGDDDINWLRNYAKELSTTTTNAGIRITATSKEIMDGFTTIGSKRPELLQNKEAMADLTKQALTLAATGVPVEEAFNVVTASLNQFNLEAKDGQRVINAIAAGSLAGSAEANNLGESLKNVGTVANDSNMTLEDTVAMLEVLASKQLLNEEAGTKMRGGLLKLKEAGVGYASGAFNVRDALIEVNAQLDKKATAAEKDALKTKIFGAENVTVGTIMLQNIDAYDKMRTAVTGTNTAYDQAIIRTKTTSVLLAQARNKFNELGMELVKNLNPAILKVTSLGNAFMKFFVELPKWINENKGLLISLTGAMSVYAMWLGVLSLSEKKLSIEKAISTTLTKGRIVADLAWCAVQQTLAGNLKTAQKAMKALNAEMKGNAYIAIGVVIAALTIGIYKLVTAQSAATKAYRDFNVQAAIETSTANQLFEAAKKNLGNKEEHKRIIDKINSVYGQYLGYQLTEKSNLDEIAMAQLQVNNALRDKIALETKETAKADVTKKYVKQQVDLADELRNNISRSKGDDLSGIFMDEIQTILKENSSDLEKGYKIASERLKMQMGSDLRPGHLASLRAYAVSVTRMNKELTEIDRKFQGFEAKKDLVIYNPGDHGKNKKTDKPTVGNSSSTSTLPDKPKKDPYNDELKVLEDFWKKDEAINKNAYAKEEFGEEVFHALMYDNKMGFLEDKLKLQKKYGQDTTETEIAISEAIISENEYWNNKEKAQDKDLLDSKKKDVKTREELAKEIAGIMEKYGVDEAGRLKAQKDLELKIAKEAYEKGIINAKQYIEVIDKINAKNSLPKWAEDAKQIAGGIANIAGEFSDAMQGFQSAEEKSIETKYQKQIDAARKAGKDTAKIEEKKNKDLAAIRAKNADSMFVVQIAGIIASTAAAAIDTFGNVVKWGGPIAAGIAAGATVAFGASQLDQAKAARDAAKEGYFYGGFTGGDDPKQVRGYFPDGSPYHGKEFVATHIATANPNLLPAFNLIDEAQKNGTVGSLSKSDLVKALNVNSTVQPASPRTRKATAEYHKNAPDNPIYAAIFARQAEVIEKLNKRLDEPIEAYSVISGKKGSFEQTKKYEKLIKNASR